MSIINYIAEDLVPDSNSEREKGYISRTYKKKVSFLELDFVAFLNNIIFCFQKGIFGASN